MNGFIDLVADVGESFGNYQMSSDETLFPLLTSANLACGFHAGDPRVMDAAVLRCAELGVAAGAHPGFPDLVGFGRRDIVMTRNEVYTDVLYQIGALSAFARARGVRLHHVAPHGRLGNLTQVDSTYARGVVDAVEAFDPTLLIVGIGGELESEGRQRGLQTARLGVVDRAYEDDGRLVSRKEPGALLSEPEEIAARTERLVTEGVIRSRNGVDVRLDVDSVLLHGDNPTAIDNAVRIRARLEAAGVEVCSLRGVLERKGAAAPTP